VLVSSKDVLEDLLRADEVDYRKVFAGRAPGRIWGLPRAIGSRGLRMLREIRSFRPMLAAGTSAEGPLIARLAGVPFINLNEDDHDAVPLYSRMAYPFSSALLMPEECRAGRWEHKTFRYPGYHELAYLHPSRFTPDPAIAAALREGGRPYILLRFSALQAHHDAGVRGISEELAMEIVRRAGSERKVVISSEKPLQASLEPFRLNTSPAQMHHVMAGADLFIGDSQTMAAEAGVLGVPFIRYNDFVGKLSYLASLEEVWQLGFGFRPGQERDLLDTFGWLTADEGIRMQWAGRRKALLEEKIDTSAFLSWFLDRYPRSAAEMRSGSMSWERFRSAVD